MLILLTECNYNISCGNSRKDNKVFVTGVRGQLGHDVVNELARRGSQSVGSDIQEVYGGVADGSAVTTIPYV